ncbi:colanic acid biosynthesis glycosyltransferase WcaL [Sphingopyxis bauzanensis]|uniref:Colanic acid biosynthesis glycosyltransferase WcaL n=1 Tax=Sphingopyxis bauzanensis TaxID=651663 RepID=A0A246JVL2_9SPHN|nr:glycosyltransferase family 4 protein [Sphingopyxis bauzanensis]OWQ97033.1 colanic acid biosynthesis glycosyltransferase WcaL [Sphingopyxis bauzanensis]GGJ41712.1 colanic acid biosynthesis glycosyltransferase WcaL [Sphingopyxis bauzanensis]
MSRIAYLVSEYDAPSHTFVRREVAALRELGVDVLPFSVRRSVADSGAASALLGRSPFAYIAALGWALASRPNRFASGWLLSLRHRAPGWKALLWAQFHFIEALLLARLLVAAGATRLHSHFANSGATVGMIAAHVAQLPWSLTLHGISETDYPAGLLLAEKLERASFVACASYFMRAQAMRHAAPKHWSKMTIVRCGIDVAALPAPAAHSVSSPARLVFVGRLSPEKGLFGLLDALAVLKASGAAFELVVVGDGPLNATIQARVGDLGLFERVQFVGGLPEAGTLAEIARADILVLPSLMEGLPVVLIEALALGRPVVASRVAGIPELIEEGESGYLFAPSDWRDLAAVLQRLLAARGDWAAMGEAGRQRVVAEFLADHAAARLVNLFEGKLLD